MPGKDFATLEDAQAKIDELENTIVASKKKKVDNENENNNLSQEEIQKLVDKQVNEKLEKERFKSQHPNLPKELEEKVEEMKLSNPNLTYEQVWKLVLDWNEQYQNQIATNWAGIGESESKWWSWGYNSTVKLSEYQAMSDWQKRQYDEYCAKNHWGFTVKADSE